MDSENQKSTVEIAVLVTKLEEILRGFRLNLSSLHENIEIFSSEPNLQSHIESLWEDAESKASSLEREVKQLKEDLKSVKEFFGLESKTKP